jgi:hypothetical protein
MTATERFKVGDRVQLGNRTGVIQLFVSDAFVIKWDGLRDAEAFTRDAVTKQFTRCGPTPTPTSARRRWLLSWTH